MARDYDDEYNKFQKDKTAYRAKLNKYNRDKGTYGNGDGLDASHKDGKIVGFKDSSKNKGKKEKSRLKGSERKKYQKGGLLKGKSHKEGGIPAIVNGEQQVELEGEEFITKASSTDILGADKLQAANDNPEDYEIIRKDELAEKGGLIKKYSANQATMDTLEYINTHGDLPMSDARKRRKK